MTTSRMYKFLAAGLVGLMLVAASLSGIVLVGAQEETEEAPTEFNISLQEFQFKVEGQDAGSAIELEAGKLYQFNVTNIGTLTHEVLIGQNAIMVGEGMHHDYDGAMLADVEVAITGETESGEFAIGVTGLNEFELAPRQSLSITFTLPDEKAGEWEMGCFVFVNPDDTEENPGPAHYDVGMHIPIIVSAAME